MKIKAIAIIVFFSITANAKTWQVGPNRTYTYCDKVVNLVQQGDTVRVDAAIYKNVPQVIWKVNKLYIVGVGGKPRLEAGATIANDMSNGKGIFVISGSNIKVENIEFANAAVIDNNGAGIRQEGANLYVTKCRFVANEMGILCGNIPNCKTTVEFSEFSGNGSVKNPGYQHNVYINRIDTLLFRYNYSHDAIAEGHELKSRASYNFILYNRIANEKSIDSRTIDLPNGGTTILLGNIIEQGANSANNNLLGYGLEGLTNTAPHNLWICNNTFVNKKDKGSFIQIQTGTDTLFLKNNILAGAKTGGLIVGTAKFLDNTNNLIDDAIANIGFVNPASFDYHLKTDSKARDVGILTTKKVKNYTLQATLMYKDTCSFEKRVPNGILDLGAYEYQPKTASKEIENVDIAVFPNPTRGLIFIKNLSENDSDYSLFSLDGKLIKSGQIEQNSIDFSDEKMGVYFLKINHKTLKIIKLY